MPLKLRFSLEGAGRAVKLAERRLGVIFASEYREK
jgi:hypothetical protein